MAEFYKVLKADPLGDPWTPSQPGAKPIQNYWCQVEGQDWAVSVGKQVGNALLPGQHIYGDLMYAKSQKGTEYWKFKGQKVPEDVQRPQDDPSTPAQATAQQATGQAPIQGIVGDGIPGWAVPLYNMVEYIYKEMRKMDDQPPAEVKSPLAKEEAPAPEPAKVEQIAGDPIDEETQATLDSIFGGGEPEPEVPGEK